MIMYLGFVFHFHVRYYAVGFMIMNKQEEVYEALTVYLLSSTTSVFDRKFRTFIPFETLFSFDF